MKKVLLLILLITSIILVGCNKSTNTTAKNQQLPSYISGNYYPKYNFLNLRSKNLTTMPDICTDITTGNMLYDIRYIDLGDNQITDIDADYSCLPNLQELNLSYNKIKNIKNLKNLSFLKKLELHKNQIENITGLEGLKTLNELNLGYNQLTSVKGLEKLRNLKTLELQHNQIIDIGTLQNLSNLETLKVEYNQIKDVVQFAAIKEVLKGLKFFSTGGNME